MNQNRIDNGSHYDILAIMYVCVCNALKEETVRLLAAEGLSFEEIQDITGCAGSCGSCLEFAESLVRRSQAQVSRSNVIPLMAVA